MSHLAGLLPSCYSCSHSVKASHPDALSELHPVALIFTWRQCQLQEEGPYRQYASHGFTVFGRPLYKPGLRHTLDITLDSAKYKTIYENTVLVLAQDDCVACALGLFILRVCFRRSTAATYRFLCWHMHWSKEGSTSMFLSYLLLLSSRNKKEAERLQGDAEIWGKVETDTFFSVHHLMRML